MVVRTKKLSDREQSRLDHKSQAEYSLESFINHIHPKRWLGNIHRDTISWWTASNAKSNQLLLLPRDHMKSAMVAYRCVWELTRNPSLRILYISSTSNLATKQLKFMKDILTSDRYRAFWPEMVLEEEAKREKWTEREISVDHPQRKEDAIRDPSIFTAGLTTNIIGMHADIIVLDDVVVANNAYTSQGREKVLEQYGFLASIAGTGSKEWIVGTRYHPNDLYSSLMEMEIEQYDEDGSVVSFEPLFEVKEHAVESNGDGTGEFLWPRTKMPDGKWYGFNSEELSKKRSKYKGNIINFRSQYYNDPQDTDSSPIKRNLFQYYDNQFLNRKDGQWYFKRSRLNVVAAVDFAYSKDKKADYSCVVVVGVDGDNNYYVLDIDRFKASKPSEYFPHILSAYSKWGFRKLRAEVSLAQQVIVNDIKDNYIRKNGLALSIDEYRPSRWIGSKEERILAILEPKYQNNQMWHYMGGNIQTLEEELILQNPAHDDVKDALASAVDFAIAPINYMQQQTQAEPAFAFHSRWGGVS